jgi:hypothetical protein
MTEGGDNQNQKRKKIAITALVSALLLLLPGLLNPLAIADKEREGQVMDSFKAKDPLSEEALLLILYEDCQLIVLAALESALAKDVNGNTMHADEKVEGVLTKIAKAIKAVIDALEELWT